MSDAAARTSRIDYQATSDPALSASADRGEANLLSYRALYQLWERQQWATQDLDFTQDRIDWHERIPTSRSARASCATWSPAISVMRSASRRRWRDRPGRRGRAQAGLVRRARPGRDALRRVIDEIRAFAFKALERRLKVIGLLGAAA